MEPPDQSLSPLAGLPSSHYAKFSLLWLPLLLFFVTFCMTIFLVNLMIAKSTRTQRLEPS